MKLSGLHLLYLAACMTVTLHAFHFNHTCDDAYISFQYAKNMATGHGPVWYPGERVMGYSNPLWTALLALGEWLQIPSPVGSRWLGALCTFGILLLMTIHFQRRGVSLLVAAVGLFMVALNGVMALWMFGGLEGPLLNLLLLRAVLLSIDTDVESNTATWLQVGICLGLCGWTRPEAILYTVTVCLYVGFRSSESRQVRIWRKQFGQAAMVGVTAASLYALLLIFQLGYYGDLFPNTYYARRFDLSLELVLRGISLTHAYMESYFGVPVLLLFLYLWFRVRRRVFRGDLPLGIFVTFFLFYLSIGGDVLVFFRMWQVTVPMIALLSAEIVSSLRADTLSWNRYIVAGAVFLLLLSVLPASFSGFPIEYLREDDRHLQELEQVARELRALPPDTVVAANVVGILAYESDLRILDMLGLNDRHIARAQTRQLGIPGHESHDGAYVLGRRPDLILLGYPVLRDPRVTDVPLFIPVYPSDVDLLSQDGFEAAYHPVGLQIDSRIMPMFSSSHFFERMKFADNHPLFRTIRR